MTTNLPSVDVPITAVAALGRAYVTASKTPNPADTNFDFNDPNVVDLTTTSSLQIRHGPGSSSGHVTWWQVVEFTNPADVNVQRGTTSLTTPALSTTATLGTAVNVNKTFVLTTYTTAASGASALIGPKMLRAQLTNSTTLTFDRGATDPAMDMPEIGWQAIELKDTSTVQRGSQNFTAGAAQRATAISSVNTQRSVAFASVQPVGGQNMGKTPYAGGSVLGVCSVTMALTSTQVTMDRNSTVDTCDVGWFVVEFGYQTS